ncbi:MAG: DUF1501 domain-containing protein [Planctomycetaceae bacterium]
MDRAFHHQDVRLERGGVSRRSFLHVVSAASVAAGTLSFRDLVSLQAAELRQRRKSMILLWMQGAPSQFETFDPKPGTDNGGSTESIETAVPGIRIAQGWNKTAAAMNDIALIRSMTNREGNHQRATYQLHTGYVPSGSVKHPSIGASVAKELADPENPLPAVVSVGRTIGAGFLGVNYEPLVVNAGRMPENIAGAVSADRFRRRGGLLDKLEDEFAERGGRDVVEDHRKLYAKAADLFQSTEVEAFDLSKEPQSVQLQYGETNFGRGCLLARRLVERGVTFVEVSLGGWDTHADNFERTGRLAAQTDPGFAALVTDLKQRGLLESTLVVWMGEFGRTPRINARTGRDHYPRAFNVALAGGGVHGGRAIGSTTADGTAVADSPVGVTDLFCSFCHSLGVDPAKENYSPLGRPMKIVDGGSKVEKLFA